MVVRGRDEERCVVCRGMIAGDSDAKRTTITSACDGTGIGCGGSCVLVSSPMHLVVVSDRECSHIFPTAAHLATASSPAPLRVQTSSQVSALFPHLPQEVSDSATAPCSEGDIRRIITRFSKEDYLKHNMAIVDLFRSIAAKKGLTPAQASLAWVASLGPKVVPIPGSS